MTPRARGVSPPEPGSEPAVESGVEPADRSAAGRRSRRERKSMVLRLDPDLHGRLARWAADELRSTNAQVEWLLARAVAEAGR